MVEQKRHQKLIIDNRSSRPLYESYDTAFECYFQHWSEEQPEFACTTDEFKFYVTTNKQSITIQIYDNK